MFCYPIHQCQNQIVDGLLLATNKVRSYSLVGLHGNTIGLVIILFSVSLLNNTEGYIILAVKVILIQCGMTFTKMIILSKTFNMSLGYIFKLLILPIVIYVLVCYFIIIIDSSPFEGYYFLLGNLFLVSLFVLLLHKIILSYSNNEQKAN